MSSVDMAYLDYEARGLLAKEPAGDYERWAQEIFRRRYAKAKVVLEEAEAAYREASKGGIFTKEEAEAHTKQFNEACTNLSIKKAWASHLVIDAAGELEFAKKIDKWTSADPEYRFATLPGSPEEKRDLALREATEQMESDMDDVNQDEIGFSRSGGRRGGNAHKRAIVQAFEKRKAAIEEEYYASRI